MKKAVVIDSNEAREILAEKFDVPVENVIKSQYSYTVILEKECGGKLQGNSNT